MTEWRQLWCMLFHEKYMKVLEEEYLFTSGWQKVICTKKGCINSHKSQIHYIHGD